MREEHNDFPKSVDAHNRSGKAKASEMEHAIRWHIKVSMDKDPALYTQFSERLQRILDEHKEHWDVIVQELNRLRDDMAKGRNKEGQFVPEHVAPFLDLILMHTGTEKTDAKLLKKIAPLSIKVFETCRGYLMIPNIWKKNSECKKWSTELQDELEYCGIDEISTKAAILTTEIINLAKSRKGEVLRANG